VTLHLNAEHPEAGDKNDEVRLTLDLPDMLR
jgi:hypothetical protein